MNDMKTTLLQQVEFHLLKFALIRLHSELKGRSAGTRIVVVIHDAIWIEALAEEAGQARNLIRSVMTTAAKLSVPLEVDIK
jgi:DNA polymerase-1